MKHFRTAVAAVAILVVLPSCSLLIDTNPDGIIDRKGGGSGGGGKNAAGVPGSGGSSKGLGVGGTISGTTSAAAGAGAATTSGGSAASLVGTAGQTSSTGTTSGGGAATGGGSSNIGGAAAGGAPPDNGGATTGGVGTSPSGGGAATGGLAPTSNGGTATGGAPQSTGGAATGGIPASTGGAGTGGPAVGCTIDTVFYPSGATKPGNACLICKPEVANWAWVTTFEGDSCGSGQVCEYGICKPGCWIDGTYRAASAAHPSGICRACKPGVSTTTWTTDAATCGCTGNLEAVQESTGLCVAKMVAVPDPNAASNYSIDSTEVTRIQYETWLVTTTTTTFSSQNQTKCGWNGEFTADDGCMGGTHVCQGAACGNHPQVCVDWCDAYAYCEAAGKRLCGKIGGGENPTGDYANAASSQWYNACSSGGANTFPYGIVYSGLTCNGRDYWSDVNYATIPVGNATGCQTPSQGPYAGAYDLNGNVWEWEDSCYGTGQSTTCRLRGGSFESYENELICGFERSYGNIASRSPSLGFRCCSL